MAAYKQIADFGGDCGSSSASDDAAHPCYAERGYDGEIDAYRDAHQWKDAAAVAAEAAKAYPKDNLIQLTYANQLVDTGQVDQGLALMKAQLNGGPDDRDAVENLAQTYIRLKRFKEANEQLDKADALASKPYEKLSVLFLRGMYYDRQKMYDQAKLSSARHWPSIRKMLRC